MWSLIIKDIFNFVLNSVLSHSLIYIWAFLTDALVHFGVPASSYDLMVV